MSDAGDGCDRRFGLPWPELNDGLSYDDVVSPSDDGSTLIEFYGSKYRNSAPFQGWMQRIQNGQIIVDGCVTTNSDERLRVGSKLVYHRLPWKEPDTPYSIGILYEDEHMVGVVLAAEELRIALNKPSGLQVLPGGLFQQRTVLSQLQRREKKRALQMGQEPQPVPVHRLGRGTSGILLCAKTKVAKSRLSAYFADGTSLIAGTRNTGMETKPVRKITKFYRALVKGIIGEDELIISQPIGVAEYSGVAKGLYVATPSGKHAVSKVKVLERDVERHRTIVQVEIQSGRPHQIRIHLSFIGHPLICDPLYIEGGKPRGFTFDDAEESFALDGGHLKPRHPLPGDCGYFLHAHQLILFHPMTDEVLTITAPLPSILQTQNEALDSCKLTIE